MMIDFQTKNTLSINYVLERLNVLSPYGKILRKELKPFQVDELELLQEEYQKIEEVLSKYSTKQDEFNKLRTVFRKMKPIELTCRRLESEEVLSETELFEIKSFLFRIKELTTQLQKIDLKIEEAKKIKRVNSLEKLLDPEETGVESFYLYDAYSIELSSLRQEIKKVTQEIKQMKKQMAQELSKEYDVEINRRNEIIVEKIERRLLQLLKADDRVRYKNESLMYTTFEINEEEILFDKKNTLECLKENERRVKESVIQELSRALAKEVNAVVENYKAVGRLDLLISKVIFAQSFNCCRPVIDDYCIEIERGRHIYVEHQLRKEQLSYQPIDLLLTPGVTIITGANMGGKTVTLKMIGLLIYMAQLGLYVPAEKFVYTPVNFIMTSIGDLQDVNKGLSTFGAEVESIKKAITLSTKQGLLLIDELARGTNPREGYAISKGVVEYFKSLETFTIISTHFDQVADESTKHLQVKGLERLNENLSVESLHEHMNYQLVPVTKNYSAPKDALRISELLGLDQKILKKANEIIQRGCESSEE